MQMNKSTWPEHNSSNDRERMKTLKVGAAFPDPPFNGMPDDTGLDIDLMAAIAESLSTTVEFVRYEGKTSTAYSTYSTPARTTASRRVRPSHPNGRPRHCSSRLTSSPDNRSPSTPSGCRT
jgi:hypothetical protein